MVETLFRTSLSAAPQLLEIIGGSARDIASYVSTGIRPRFCTTPDTLKSDMANCIRCGRQLPPFSFKKICQWCVRHEAAQRGEEDDYQPVITQPWVRRSESSISLTQILFGACIAVYVAMAIASGSPTNIPGDISRHFGANFGPDTL